LDLLLVSFITSSASGLSGIRRMGPGLDANIFPFGAFDKAEPSRSRSLEHRMADDRPKPPLSQGI